ncbi:MAG: PKD domain-containing protein [Candidatus Methylomirabilales bacterium]
MKRRIRLRRILWSLIAVGLLLGLYPVAATAGSVSLSWDSNTEADLAGYKVYIGTSPGIYTQTIDSGNVTTCTVPNLSEGQTYFFTVTAYDIFANESDFSNEISAAIAAGPEPTPEPTSEPPPPIPGSPQLSGDVNNITVSWPGLEGYPALTGYHVRLGINQTEWAVDQIVGQQTTTATFAGNGPGSYWTCVRTINTADMESDEQMCNGKVFEPLPEPEPEPTPQAASEPAPEPTPEPVNSPPGASFTVSCLELICSFTNTSIDSDGSVVAWRWDFGEGASSIEQSPSHSYASDGTYSVTLVVTDDDGATDATSRGVTVTCEKGKSCDNSNRWKSKKWGASK